MRVAELVGFVSFDWPTRSPPIQGLARCRYACRPVGICGSDMHSYSEGEIGDTRCRTQMVPWPRAGGVVTRIGPG